MLKWYSIKPSSPDNVRSILHSLRSQHLMVRQHNEHLVACVSNHHQAWLSRVCQDFHADLKVLETAPAGIKVPAHEVYTAPCGQEIYDPILYTAHFRNCPKCKAAKEGKVVAKLEPGQEHDLNGVIVSLEVVRDRLMEKCEMVDNLINNLKAYHEAKDKLSELHTEVDMRIAAVKLLITEGRLTK